MHELSVTEALLNTASDYAKRQNANKVTVLNIIIGKLSGIIDDSVQFYWDIIAKETICEGSRLNFTIIPAKFECQNCQHQFEMEDELIPCPRCQSMDLATIQGDEFLLESIEIEKEKNE
jgi:hydrogenase nickel incorporation protein HypA/HybF